MTGTRYNWTNSRLGFWRTKTNKKKPETLFIFLVEIKINYIFNCYIMNWRFYLNQFILQEYQALRGRHWIFFLKQIFLFFFYFYFWNSVINFANKTLSTETISLLKVLKSFGFYLIVLIIFLYRFHRNRNAH